ncbi:MAG: hypothetical protein GYA24_10310 [Candidatus Lokiarchaeota archaeon]|nr:hypothetical protein [Candidatus Lokiarchaeota archaeon]
MGDGITRFAHGRVGLRDLEVIPGNLDQACLVVLRAIELQAFLEPSQ